jgi:hypothetical protein
MLRCVLALLIALAAAVPAHAQRVFNADVLRGELQLTNPPEAQLNGGPIRLSPGARIRNRANLIQLSGSLLGQKLLVNYTLDPAGDLFEVWILTDDELTKTPWPTTREQALSWVFDSATQRWSRP